MKKAEVILTLLLTCISANSRTWIGGNVVLGGAGYETDQEAKLEKTLQLYPTLGFTIDDKWECGISAGIGHIRNIGGLFYGEKKTDLLLNPFVRYILWNNGTISGKGDISFFVQSNLMYDYNSRPCDVQNESGTGYRTFKNIRNTFGISFQPGFKYCFDRHIVISATFGDLYVQTTRLESNQGTDLNGRKTFVPDYERRYGKGGLEIGRMSFSIAYQF